MDTKKAIAQNRIAIKPQWTDLKSVDTDRARGLDRPELFKELGTERIDLTKDFSSINKIALTDAIRQRRSLRKYSTMNMSFEELSYLLDETSRVDFVKNNAVFRSIPTGGATNPMETYVFVNRVDDIETGLYHYIQDKHALEIVEIDSSLRERVHKAILHQLRNANIVVFFTAVPYRSEYKYSFAAHKMIMIEAGHAAQNLSLSSEAIDCGAVCIAAYDQRLCDHLLQVDGEEEFTTYVVALGKKVA